MTSEETELLQTFSVRDAYSRATLSHPRRATAPLIAVLVEALYYLANELRDTLVAGSKVVVKNFCQRLRDRVKQQDYYRQLDRLLGEDTGIQLLIDELETQLIHALVSEAKTECDRYVRESPRFYDEGTFSIYQFRQTLEQTSQGYDCASIVDAEPAIRQLLKLDFKLKVSTTIRRNFHHTISMTIKSHLLPMAQQQADKILQYYPQARKVLEQTLEQEAITKIALNQKLLSEVKQEIEQYNTSINELNNCLQSLDLSEYNLPIINSEETNIDIKLQSETFNNEGNGSQNHFNSFTTTTHI